MLTENEERAVAEPLQGPVPSAPAGRSWEDLMGRALHLAAEAEAAGEIPVGAVIADAKGRIVGEGRNGACGRCDPTAHAEIAAIRSACRRLGNYRLAGCVLVVTMEPCVMCAGAIVHARLDGVVYGCRDALAGAVVSRADILDAPFLNHRVWHMGGILSGECAGIVRAFFAKRR